MSSRQAIKFKQTYPPYNSGDVAVFDIPAAHILINAGYADPVDNDNQQDVYYKGMSWFALRAEVKKLTGQSPSNKTEALRLLKQGGHI